jgi:hypothetical protein
MLNNLTKIIISNRFVNRIKILILTTSELPDIEKKLFNIWFPPRSARGECGAERRCLSRSARGEPGTGAVKPLSAALGVMKLAQAVVVVECIIKGGTS